VSLEGTQRGTLSGEAPELRGLLEDLESSYPYTGDQQPFLLLPRATSLWVKSAAIFLDFYSLSFVFHLSLLADNYGNYHGPISAGDAWYMHHWVCRTTTGMSWRVTSMLELVVWLQNNCHFLSCYVRESQNVLMAERQTLHLHSWNTLHMDQVKRCFCIFLYKASFTFLLVGLGLILVSFMLLPTGSNPSEARI